MEMSERKQLQFITPYYITHHAQCNLQDDDTLLARLGMQQVNNILRLIWLNCQFRTMYNERGKSLFQNQRSL